MKFFKQIHQLFNERKLEAKGLKIGDTLNPLDILSYSGTFPLLNLNQEEIVLVYVDKSERLCILTNKQVFRQRENGVEVLPLSESVTENLGFTEEEANEQLFFDDVVAMLINTKQKATATLDGFLAQYKHLAESQKENHENAALHFDGKYLEMLQHEAEEALRFCAELDQDPHFIQSLNLVFNNSDQAIDGYKAVHLFLADIIKSYNKVIGTETPKTQFILAYFFEKLQGNDLAKGITVARLNEMVTKPAFLENLQKIKSAEIVRTLPAFQEEYILPSILKKMNHLHFAKSGNLVYRFASLVAKADNEVGEAEKEALKIILEKTAKPKVQGSTSAQAKELPPNDSLEKVLAELNELIGLEEIKKNVNDLVNLLKVSKIRSEKGLENIEISLHSVFLGPPGTGKTTVSRLMGRMFKHLEYLSKGHLIETDRAGMVAGYVGQTAIKVDELVQQSVGGVLFIDEAYALTGLDSGRDFGTEAVDTLIKRMEDLREDLVVIVAGYTEPMKFFVESNPGLRSRFNRFFKFEHFLPTQLLSIFESFATKADFSLTDDAKDKLLATFDLLYEKRDEGFGNARVVRNLFERVVQLQANRLVNVAELDEKTLQTIEETDIPEPKVTEQQVFFTKPEEEGR